MMEIYKGYAYEIFEDEGYIHYSIQDVDGYTLATSMTVQGDPTFKGSQTEGEAQRRVKATINRLRRIGF